MAGAVELRGVAAAAARAGSGVAAAWWGRLRTHLLAWRPALVALALAAAAVAAHGVLWDAQAPWGRAGLAGGLMAAAGLVWMLWAAALLRIAGTPMRPTAQPLVLIDEGPYRFGRHPMYLGIAALMAGAALGLGMPSLGGAAGLFMAIVATVHVPHEEAQLLRRFGGWYRDYAGSVRRWL